MRFSSCFFSLLGLLVRSGFLEVSNSYPPLPQPPITRAHTHTHKRTLCWEFELSFLEFHFFSSWDCSHKKPIYLVAVFWYNNLIASLYILPLLGSVVVTSVSTVSLHFYQLCRLIVYTDYIKLTTWFGQVRSNHIYMCGIHLESSTFKLWAHPAYP